MEVTGFEKLQESDSLEDVSNASDSIDCLPEISQPDSDERDVSPVNWGSDTEARSSGLSVPSTVLNGVVLVLLDMVSMIVGHSILCYEEPKCSCSSIHTTTGNARRPLDYALKTVYVANCYQQAGDMDFLAPFWSATNTGQALWQMSYSALGALCSPYFLHRASSVVIWAKSFRRNLR
ncbi:hypothetical protein Vadar_029884 [Vaccinium darrowii]|uniref:Uncharacterized protein n=1 Tax=Vaccinium darrowii TaxID=229202 RepID=A0ACB7YZF2_9ERIC|nr:hypothetical protein Vadar_029884 [Vaccinium darrowii]